MLRNLVRAGASVLVAGALLGGGLALGAGTASAEEAPGSASGSTEMFGSPLDWVAMGVLAAGQAGGSVGDLTFGCNPKQGADCDFPTPSEILLALLQGRDPHTL
ncbi:hypothetical protein BTZ20_5806 [Rhodococcus sp. MTM3W5.2]|uniref:hypothetical protein n=1 Tax=Rhodococcus sp. MTM3W5.2 TaxID=1805827 RepID=UPI0009794F12|nr:hypothetical protein [Rhodococcus sp. MTM3W5.2]AQA24227.1 hypothetical protein BTZ20_5806 [Rhodococcus sp. MTM3W5.2]